MRTRKALITALLLAALTVPTLSGCANGGPGAAAIKAGLAGEIVEQLKEEDDAAGSEEASTLREVRQEAYERSQEEEVEWH